MLLMMAIGKLLFNTIVPVILVGIVIYYIGK